MNFLDEKLKIIMPFKKNNLYCNLALSGIFFTSKDIYFCNKVLV
jgi:hypothetical protein